jgi:hypothetical protein
MAQQNLAWGVVSLAGPCHENRQLVKLTYKMDAECTDATDVKIGWSLKGSAEVGRSAQSAWKCKKWQSWRSWQWKLGQGERKQGGMVVIVGQVQTMNL